MIGGLQLDEEVTAPAKIPSLEGYLGRLHTISQTRDRIESRQSSVSSEYAEVVRHLGVLEDVNKILSIVNDTNTSNTIDFITAVVNKTLGQMFKGDPRSIVLEKSLYAGKHVHLNVTLTTSDGTVRDLKTQSGTGLRQVVSFLFLVSLIELRKGRRILFMDELLSGVHSSAKAVLGEIMQIFAESGFQFVMVEYGINDLGRIYNVEKPGTQARVYALGDRKYTEEVFMFTEGLATPDLENMPDEASEGNE